MIFNKCFIFAYHTYSPSPQIVARRIVPSSCYTAVRAVRTKNPLKSIMFQGSVSIIKEQIQRALRSTYLLILDKRGFAILVCDWRHLCLFFYSVTSAVGALIIVPVMGSYKHMFVNNKLCKSK
jgi:hypothetical protein